MNFQHFAPNPLLSRLVKFYWTLTGNELSTQKIIPDGFPEWIFHFGQPYQINSSGKFERQSASLVAGQLLNPILIRPEGESGIVAVKFQPTALWKLFGINMETLTNETIDAIDVFDKKFSDLSARILESKTITESVEWIENFLLKQLSVKCREDFANHIADDIMRSKGEVSIGEIARHHHVSERQLQRKFKEAVGVSPKRFAKIARYKNVCSLISDPALSLTDAVYLAGYFDQPHFNKDFAEFTGENPNQFLSQNHRFAKFFINTM